MVKETSYTETLYSALGSGPNRFSPLVPSMQQKTSKIKPPNGTKPNNTHHPLLSVSCNRLTRTEMLGSNNPKTVILPKTPKPDTIT